MLPVETLACAGHLAGLIRKTRTRMVSAMQRFEKRGEDSSVRIIFIFLLLGIAVMDRTWPIAHMQAHGVRKERTTYLQVFFLGMTRFSS